MATPRKRKKQAPRRVKTVDTPEYNQLEMYCIWLNEFYSALKRAGFKHDIALTIMMDKDSYPDWVKFRLPDSDQISNIIDEEDED